MEKNEKMQLVKDLVNFAINGNVEAVDEILQKSIDICFYIPKSEGKINILQFTPLHQICYSLTSKNPIKQIMSLIIIFMYDFMDNLPDCNGRFALDLLPEEYQNNLKLFLIESKNFNLSKKSLIRKNILENYLILNETNDLKTIYKIEKHVNDLIGYTCELNVGNTSKRLKLSF